MKRLLAITAVILLVLLSAVPCFAAGPNDTGLPRLIDNAGVLNASEKSLLKAEISKVINKYSYDMVILIVNSTGGKTDRAFSDDFYDYQGYGSGYDRDGLALVLCLDPQDRFWYTSCRGATEKYWSMDVEEYIADTIYDDMFRGNYGEALVKYVNCWDYIYSGSYQSDRNSGAFATALVPGSLLAIISGLINVAGKKSKMRTISIASTASGHLDRSSFILTRSNDIFLYRTQTRTKNVTVADGSGSTGSHGTRSYSSGHISSSGAHHSGGGRHF